MNFFSPNLFSLNFYGCNLLLCWPKTVQKISFNWHQVFVHFTWVSSFLLKPGCSMILKICPFFCLSICLPNFHICCLFPYLSLCLSLSSLVLFVTNFAPLNSPCVSFFMSINYELYSLPGTHTNIPIMRIYSNFKFPLLSSWIRVVFFCFFVFF